MQYYESVCGYSITIEDDLNWNAIDTTNNYNQKHLPLRWKIYASRTTKPAPDDLDWIEIDDRSISDVTWSSRNEQQSFDVNVAGQYRHLKLKMLKPTHGVRISEFHIRRGAPILSVRHDYNQNVPFHRGSSYAVAMLST